MTVDLPAETVTQGWQLYDNTILASVPASSLVEKYGSYNGLYGSMGDGLLYAGLPKLNAGFGNHLVTLTVNKNNSQQAHIQTFFSAKANNYPSALSDYNASSSIPANRYYTPNWYHYYNQVYASTGNYDSIASGSYTDAQSPPTYPIHIANDAYGASYIRVFVINPISPHYIRYVGDLDINGIHRFIYVCAHEAGHQTLLAQGGVYNFSAYPAKYLSICFPVFWAGFPPQYATKNT
ncbi:MAG: hypothetical protein ACRYFS_21540 [Janthinobacterium lividum]